MMRADLDLAFIMSLLELGLHHTKHEERLFLQKQVLRTWKSLDVVKSCTMPAILEVSPVNVLSATMDKPLFFYLWRGEKVLAALFTPWARPPSDTERFAPSGDGPNFVTSKKGVHRLEAEALRKGREPSQQQSLEQQQRSGLRGPSLLFV